jgi:hypothetical protein
MSLRVVPIDFRQDGKPANPSLHSAVQEYAKNEFGEELNFGYYAKVHTLINEEADKITVMGLLGSRAAIDVCMFHITVPSQDKDGLRLAEQGRDLMFQRGQAYLADLGHTGTTVLVYVAAEAERYWRRFLRKIGAKPAHRYEVEVK